MAYWFQRWAANRRESQERRKAQEALAREEQQKERDWYWAESSKIRALSTNEALIRVLQESENRRITLTRDRATDMEILDLLPETARDFFGEVSEVYIDPIQWGIYRKDFNIDSVPGYVELGDPSEGDPVAIKYYEDGLYYEYDENGHLDLEKPYYRSVFHLILISLLNSKENPETG